MTLGNPDFSQSGKQDFLDPALDSTEVGIKKSDLTFVAKGQAKPYKKKSSAKKRAKGGKVARGRGGLEEIFPLERPGNLPKFDLCTFFFGWAN